MGDQPVPDLAPVVYAYAMGLVSMSVCAPASMPPADVEASVNAKWPTGIGSPWALADEPFAGGHPQPGPCDRDGSSRTHYLLHC